MIIIVYKSDISILPETSFDSLRIDAKQFFRLFSNSQQNNIVETQLKALETFLPEDFSKKEVIWLIPNSLKASCLDHLKPLSHDVSLSWQNYDENIFEKLGIKKDTIIDGIIDEACVTEVSSEEIKFINILELETEENLENHETLRLIQNIDTKIVKLDERLSSVLEKKSKVIKTNIVGIVIGLVILVLLIVLFFKSPSSTESFPKTFYDTKFNEINSQLNEIQKLLKNEVPNEDEVFGQQADDAHDETTTYAKDYDTWLKKADKLIKSEKYQKAIESYDKALKFKHDYWPWYNRGIALSKLKRYEEAINSFDRALEFKSKFKFNLYYYWYNRGIALRELKRYEEAIDSFDRALEIEQQQFWGWYELASTFSKLKRYKKAINNYDKALKIKPGSGLAKKEREMALEKLKILKTLEKSVSH